MNLRRMSAACAAAAVLATVQIAAAGPAAADHTVDIDVTDTSCFKGEIALGIPIQLRTERVVLRTHRDGTLTAGCHFKGLPSRIDSEELGTWIGPTELTRMERPSECSLHGPGFDQVFGDASIVITPAGTLKVQCTFVPPFGPPA